MQDIVKCWLQSKRDVLIIVIPKTIRQVTGIKSQDRFMIINKGKDILILKKIKSNDRQNLRGDKQ